MSSWTGTTHDEQWTRLEALIGRIAHAENAKLVRRYLYERSANGIKASTLGNDANCLKAFCEWLGAKSLKAVVKDDIVDYVIEGRRHREWRNEDKHGRVTITKRTVKLKPSTLKQRKICLRAFYKWLEGTENPPQFDGLKNHAPTKSSTVAEKVIPKDDLRKLLQAHPHPRDKAIFAMLYESGFRAGELCALNVESLKFERRGTRVSLPSDAPGLKSGPRDVLLLDSVTYVQQWYENHPRRDERGAPLFYGMSHRAPGRRLSGNALYSLIQAAGKRAGLDYNLHPHMFRHSAATERARLGWSEMQMRNFFGWSKRSDMPATYIHLAGKDYENMELERRGWADDTEKAEPALTPITCRICKEVNLPTAKFCSQCRNPVAPEAIAAMDAEDDRKLEERLDRLLAKRGWTEHEDHARVRGVSRTLSPGEPRKYSDTEEIMELLSAKDGERRVSLKGLKQFDIQ